MSSNKRMTTETPGLVMEKLWVTVVMWLRKRTPPSVFGTLPLTSYRFFQVYVHHNLLLLSIVSMPTVLYHTRINRYTVAMKLIHTLLLLSITVTAQAQNFPSLEAADKAYNYAQRIAGNNAHWRDLADAALWVSSVNAGQGAEERAAAFLAQIEAAAAELAAELPRDPKERGEYVLGFIHRRYLKSYVINQTRLDEIFISGRYNCVSSAVLYMALAVSAGLDVEGVMTRDHAFATIAIGADRFDVETTNPYGFDPGNRKEFHDGFGQTTGFAYVPARNYRDRAAIGRGELISLILSNRIAALEERNRFEEAVPLAVNRAVLLSGITVHNNASSEKTQLFGDPQKDMMTRLSNLGAHFIQTGKEDNAIAWAFYAGERFPDPLWDDQIKTAANNKLVKLIRAKKTGDARSFLATVKPRLSNAHYMELEILVLETEIAEKINTIGNPGDAEAALASFNQVKERLPPGRRDEMLTTIILNETSRLGKSQDWAASIKWLEGAIAQYGRNAKLESALRTVRQNRVNELHNAFAALFNKGDYEQAKATVKNALQEFPNERQLANDLAIVERAMQ